MKSSLIASAILLIAVSLPFVGNANAQSSIDRPGAIADRMEVKINIDNFVRAATDIEFEKYVSLAGGVNRFFHFREPTPVDNQPTVRMNRDTLYSAAIIDISQGATLKLPDVGERYMTAMVVNQDHYINGVFSGGGTFTLDMDTFGTPYVIVYMRVLVDAADPEDVAAVNAIQDQMMIEAASAKAFIPPNYDEDSFNLMLSTLITLAPFVPNSFHMFGSRDEVDPVRHLLGTAGGWGGLPESEAFYLNVAPGLPPGEYKIEVPADVPVGAFWSISLYNAEGFFVPNDRNAYNVNSVTGVRDDKGMMTVHLGGCDDGRVNCLPIMEGWNYTVRMYRPGQEILKGNWTFPEAKPVQ
jgi:hypothetical protein